MRALPLPSSLQVRCQLSTSFRCASLISTACNAAAGALPALYIVPTRVSHLNRYLSRYRCVASSLHYSNASLPLQLLVTLRQVRCQLSTSFRRASPISTACNTATGALPAPYIVPMRVSHFNSLQYHYRFVAGSLPRSNARLPFQPLAIWRQVHCPALNLVPTGVSHFNRVQYGYRCVVNSLPRSDAHLQFQPLAIRLPALPALYLVPMRISLFNCYLSPYMFTASVNLSEIEYIELAIRIE